MKLKQIPEDFIVNELYDIEKFKLKDEGKTEYYYFLLQKKDYNQIKAIELIAQSFNTSTKLIHIAGTKDKVGITTQVISVYGIKEENFEKNLEYFNSTFTDLHLTYLNKFKGRLNLGDNLGNKFEITLRDLSENEIETIKINFEKIKINGILNYFDEQRFGYANNSHIIGKYILKKEIEKAVYEILTSLPQNPKEELKTYVEFIKNNWEKIKLQDKNIYENAIKIMPKFLSEQKLMLNHLMKYKNDFSGSFRTLHKKLRTLYINAYQSYIFNEALTILKNKNLIDNYTQINLISKEMDFDEVLKPMILEILKQDEISIEDLNLSSMPELKIFSNKRNTKVYPKNMKLYEKEEDELNSGKNKIKIEFELKPGEYATNVVKQLL